jgi:Cu/Ag efflux pump CusA
LPDLKTLPEVALVFSKNGNADLGTDPMPPNASDTYVIPKPESEWPANVKSKDDILKRIEARMKPLIGNRTEIQQPIQMRFNELIAGVRSDGAPTFDVKIDRLAAARCGLTVVDVANTVAGALGGREAGILCAAAISVGSWPKHRTRAANPICRPACTQAGAGRSESLQSARLRLLIVVPICLVAIFHCFTWLWAATYLPRSRSWVVAVLNGLVMMSAIGRRERGRRDHQRGHGTCEAGADDGAGRQPRVCADGIGNGNRR